MWFDVGIKRYTTARRRNNEGAELWFDVGIKRYTTYAYLLCVGGKLWFDVGIKRYTTCFRAWYIKASCGLM